MVQAGPNNRAGAQADAAYGGPGCLVRRTVSSRSLLKGSLSVLDEEVGNQVRVVALGYEHHHDARHRSPAARGGPRSRARSASRAARERCGTARASVDAEGGESVCGADVASSVTTAVEAVLDERPGQERRGAAVRRWAGLDRRRSIGGDAGRGPGFGGDNGRVGGGFMAAVVDQGRLQQRTDFSRHHDEPLGYT